MHIHSPYYSRMFFARTTFWVMLLLLANGWVDLANSSLRSNSWVRSYDAVVFDDFDTLYEWIAEELFDVEEATPEQENDPDDHGKNTTLKVTLASHTLDLHLDQDRYQQQMGLPFPAKMMKNIALGIWDPPPNV